MTLKEKKEKTFEDKIILISTYIDLLEYNYSNELLQEVRQNLKSVQKERIHSFILDFLENKILLPISNFSQIIQNLEHYEISNYSKLNAREKTFLILILYVKSEALFRLGNYKSSQKILNSIIEVVFDASNEMSSLSKDVISGLNYRIAFMNYLYLGEIEKATDVVYNGINIYSKANNIIYLAVFNNFKGIIFAIQGDYYTSLDSFKLSLEYFESIAEKKEIFSIKYTAAIYNNIAQILKDQGNITESIATLKSTQKLYEQNNVRHDLAYCLLSLGQCYREIQQYDLAEECFYKSYTIRKDYNDSMEISESLLNICILEETIGKLSKDSICFSEFPKDYESKVVKFNKLMMDGLLASTEKKYDLAMDILNEALNIPTMEFSYRLLILDYLADIYLEKNDFKRFSEHLKLWKALAKENNFIPSLFKANLIDFRFELLLFNIEPAKNSLQEAKKLAQNYSKGALKLVEESEELLQTRISVMDKTQKSEIQKHDEFKNYDEILEFKTYINEISSFITKFSESEK